MINYPVGDSLIRIKNISMTRNRDAKLENTKFVHSVVKAMKRAGFLSQVTKNKEGLIVSLAIHNKEPLMTNLKLVSKPGLRKYIDIRGLQKRRGVSILIISTPDGVLSSKEALKKKVGGEIIAEIW